MRLQSTLRRGVSLADVGCNYYIGGVGMYRMFDMGIFQDCFSNTVKRVQYLDGAKPPSLLCDSDELHQLDCSGWAEWIGARSLQPYPWFAGASYEIHAALIATGRYCIPYLSLAHGSAPSGTYCCFVVPTAEKQGHIWFVSNGYTYECCADGGVISRQADTEVLMGSVGGYLVGGAVDRKAISWPMGG